MQSQLILYFDNEIEAQVVSSVLQQGEIPYRLHTHPKTTRHESLQPVHGWGHLEAPGEYAPRIMDLYNSMDEEF